MESMDSFVHDNDQDTKKVLCWLDELEEIREEDEQDEVEDQVEPHTPQRRIVFQEQEVSPTNTSFSSTSIFDPPYLARREEDSDSNSDTFSITTLSPSDNNTASSTPPPPEKPQHEERPKLTPRPNLAKQLTSILTTEPYPPLTRASENQHISLHPCLSCTTSSLPCSLTLPVCSRCKRNKNTCVFTRARTGMDPGGESIETCDLPVLVRQLESDGEWEGKLDVVREVIEQEVKRGERGNWVLPMPAKEA